MRCSALACLKRPMPGLVGLLLLVACSSVPAWPAPPSPPPPPAAPVAATAAAADDSTPAATPMPAASEPVSPATPTTGPTDVTPPPLVPTSSASTTRPTEPATAPDPLRARPSPRASLVGQTVSGTGTQATNRFWLEDGIVVFRVKTEGKGSFVVDLLDEDGNRIGRLATERGNSESNKIMRVRWPGNYLFNVQSEGRWSITIDPTGGPVISAPLNPQSLSGTGMATTGRFDLEAGVYIFHVTHRGRGSFTANLLQDDGRLVATVTTGTGTPQVSKAVQIRRSGSYLFNVKSTGSWAITIEPPSG